MDRKDAIKKNPESFGLFSARLDLKKEGSRYKACCPFHSEDTPSFSLTEFEGEWRFKCFGGSCEKHGDVIEFIMLCEDISYSDALEFCEEYLSHTWKAQKKNVERVFKPIQKKEQPKPTLPLEFMKEYEQALAESREAQDWLLQERGITYETAKTLHFGYCRDISRIVHYYSNGNTDGGWILFPYVSGGRITALKARSMVSKQFTQVPGMTVGLYNSEDVEMFEPVFLVEGEFDTAIIKQAGFRVIALPSSGYKVTPEDKDLLLSGSCLILAGDNDHTAAAVMDKLHKDIFKYGCYKMVWPDNLKDANDTYLKKCNRDINEFRLLVKKMVQAAKANPMPNVVDMKEYMLSGKISALAVQNRMKFPWANLDDIFLLTPGSVLGLTSRLTGMGKTSFITVVELHEIIKDNQTVVIYQGEIDYDTYGRMIASHLLKKHRNDITQEDTVMAAEKIPSGKLFVGKDPSASRVMPILDLLEAAVQRFGATRVVLDHLHFVTTGEPDEIKAQAAAMKRIKDIATNYGLIFIVLSQPRKADQKHRDNDLQMTDIKGSEAIMSTSDSFLYLTRDYVLNKDPNTPEAFGRVVKIQRMKGRNFGKSARATTELFFRGEILEYTPVSELKEL